MELGIIESEKSLLGPQDVGSITGRNVGRYLPVDTALRVRIHAGGEYGLLSHSFINVGFETLRSQCIN